MTSPYTDPARNLRIRPLLALLALVVVTATILVVPQISRGADGGNDRPKVLVAEFDGDIDPVAVEQVEQSIHQARDGHYDALILEMDTPGGLASSMKSIKDDILRAHDLPIIVYVAPDGARAASAGAFIVLASDLAAMAPGTNIGSATPIDSSGKNVGKDLRRKIINDFAATARGLAKQHGRNQQFAEDIVRKADNITADEARDKGVIEIVARSVPSLLRQADGRKLEPKGLTLHVKDARIDHRKLPWQLHVLRHLIDPNLLFLLFSGGLIGLAFELTHPGAILPGVAGVLFLVLAMFGLQLLPISATGITLLVFAMVLFVLEAFTPSHGALALGGTVALVLGGLLLFDRNSGVSVSVPLVIGVALFMAGFFGFVVQRLLAIRRTPTITVDGALVGQRAMIRGPGLTPRGLVHVNGELWQAVTVDGADVASGTVIVDSLDGLTLRVRADAAAAVEWPAIPPETEGVTP